MSCWSFLIYRFTTIRAIKNRGHSWQTEFDEHQHIPLDFPPPDVINADSQEQVEDPFYILYAVFKEESIKRLQKNQVYLHNTCEVTGSDPVYLSTTDIDYIQYVLETTIESQSYQLNTGLPILAITVTLAPFLGLLGTVWGILQTFSELNGQIGGGSEKILEGISMALATTVLGLIVAIPALVGHNYLRNKIHSLEIELNNFSASMISALEIQYRSSDVLR